MVLDVVLRALGIAGRPHENLKLAPVQKQNAAPNNIPLWQKDPKQLGTKRKKENYMNGSKSWGYKPGPPARIHERARVHEIGSTS